jgi:putative metallohydrolase (TIGR04338 family)
MRDTQMGKLYLAEQAAFGYLKYGEQPMAGFETVKDCQRFVDRVLRRKRLRDKYGRRVPSKVTVKPGNGSRRGHADRGWDGVYVTLPKIARRSWYILHELAHLIAAPGAKHGWRFAAVYLDLVREVLGVDCYDLLREQFCQLGVEWKDPDRFEKARAA